MVRKKKEKTPEEQAKEAIDDFFKSGEWKKLKSKLRKVPLKPVKDPFETLSSEQSRKLLTHTVFDDILGRGGLSAKKIIEVYGEYGTGKTQLAWTLLVEAAEEGTVIYDDAEFSFAPERIKQIAEARGKDIEKIRKNLILYQPKDWKEQLALPTKIPSPYELDVEERPPLALIIIDSFIAPFDKSPDFMGRDKLPLRSQKFRLLLADLRDIARTHDCPIFITNQVTSNPDLSGYSSPKYVPAYVKQKAKGGPTIEHIPDIILFLRKTKSSKGVKLARVMDSYELPNDERLYIINERGIDDVPEDEKTKKKREEEKLKEEETEEEYESDKESQKTISESVEENGENEE